jgi:hypothetical protein
MSDIKELIADATDAGRKLGISQMTFGADRRKQELIEAQNKLLSEIAAMEAVVQAAVEWNDVDEIDTREKLRAAVRAYQERDR